MSYSGTLEPMIAGTNWSGEITLIDEDNWLIQKAVLDAYDIKLEVFGSRVGQLCDYGLYATSPARVTFDKTSGISVQQDGVISWDIPADKTRGLCRDYYTARLVTSYGGVTTEIFNAQFTVI